MRSVIAGVFAGLLLSAFFTWPLLVWTSARVVTFLLSVALLQRNHWKRFKQTEQIPVLFPREERR